MNRYINNRWNDFLRRLIDTYPGAETGIRSAGERVFKTLDGLYGASDRFYHTWAHVGKCLSLLSRHGGSLSSAQTLAIEAALWFHDSVYDPAGSENEKKSAALAASSLAEFGAPNGFAVSVGELIMATAHLSGTASLLGEGAAWIHDIDLAILASPRCCFVRYERRIRQEYRHVAQKAYIQRRGAVLRRFLNRDTIFVTDTFRSRYEIRARRNLVRSVGSLSRT